ncbi:YceI family protein [Algibacter miyuki]|uniref:YceI family protein n=1 Tax=Algibacter miyuki TaxID=1306933 RepID=A0ABV5GX08_9FLAO|nr:YceI family protein [Algibacter miyuki]MDN3664264.1 YceI family protein [Algibacter miyuki]
MKKVLFLISILATMAFAGEIMETTSVVIAPSSEIVITGKTNVNSFNCQYNVLELKEPIPVHFKRYNNGKLVFENTILTLESAAFDCGGPGINSDFNKLLKSKTYPEVIIELKEIGKHPKDSKLINALINLEIAGITKAYTFPVKLEGSETLNIEGVLSLNIRDFDLDPPKKALGIIVVKEVIDISFHLKAKEYVKY